MKSPHQRRCYACGFPCEVPFIATVTVLQVPAGLSGFWVVVCSECAEKLGIAPQTESSADASI